MFLLQSVVALRPLSILLVIVSSLSFAVAASFQMRPQIAREQIHLVVVLQTYLHLISSEPIAAKSGIVTKRREPATEMLRPNPCQPGRAAACCKPSLHLSTRPLLAQHDCARSIETHDMK